MKKLAILSGGYSNEYEVSIKSGKVVEKHTDRSKYEPYRIVITQAAWLCVQEEKEYPVNKNDFSVEINGQQIKFDLVFNAIHGTPGEDGKIQGYFDMLQIPITGCGVLSSALSFDKMATKQYLKHYGANIANSVLINRNNNYNVDLLLEMGLPLFVKANKMGSSVGVYMVKEAADLENAIENCLEYDDEVLVEAYLKGREFTCGVYSKNGEVIALPITEVICNSEFFDYQAKYESEATREVTPADIPDELAFDMQEQSKVFYKALKCAGVTRSDYIVVDNLPYLLEVNTVPGLSEASIIPKQALTAGYSLKDFFNILLQEAVDKADI